VTSIKTLKKLFFHICESHEPVAAAINTFVLYILSFPTVMNSIRRRIILTPSTYVMIYLLTYLLILSKRHDV